MRILFICGTYQLHNDGVADFTERLANEFVQHGDTVAIIAVNDHFIQTCMHYSHNSAQILRLPSSSPWGERGSKVSRFFRDFQPTKVSLQFVPFSFSNKGLLFNFLYFLSCLGQHRVDHIMFHELWLHPSFCSKPSQLALGQFQRFQIKRLINKIQPMSIHTSNHFFMKMLNGLGVQSSLLSIPGNIPVAASSKPPNAWLSEQLRVDLSEFHTVGFFGDFLSTFNLDMLRTLLMRFSACDKQIYILSAGRLSPYGQGKWNQIQAHSFSGVHFHLFEYLPSSEVSTYLSSIDTPVSSYPYELWSKSGAIASFLDHGKSVTLLGSLSKNSSKSHELIEISPSNSTCFSQAYSLLLQSLDL